MVTQLPAMTRLVSRPRTETRSQKFNSDSPVRMSRIHLLEPLPSLGVTIKRELESNPGAVIWDKCDPAARFPSPQTTMWNFPRKTQSGKNKQIKPSDFVFMFK